jgi:hypothetical protein
MKIKALAPDITVGVKGEATVRVVVVQGPLPGHLPRRVWLCHLTTGLMPGCSSSSPAMPLFVPEECLHPTSEGVEEPITIIEAEARNG